MWKNIVERGRPQMTIWRTRIACWTPKATNTHSQYVILPFHYNNGGTKAPHCLVIRILPLFFQSISIRDATSLSVCYRGDRQCSVRFVDLLYFISSQYYVPANFAPLNIIPGGAKRTHVFSNNCNFVYFQYKKIMSTPKQLVINAVLITYINYSITENYIGKMASFLPYTRPEPLLTVLHHIY